MPLHTAEKTCPICSLGKMSFSLWEGQGKRLGVWFCINLLWVGMTRGNFCHLKSLEGFEESPSKNACLILLTTHT